MIRVLVFLAILGALALGFVWLADHPGEIAVTWLGYRANPPVYVGIAAVVVLAVAISMLWGLLRFLLRLPSIVSIATRARRRNKGYGALSRGMIAIGAGDAEAARKATREAQRLLRNEPLTLLLRAQAAQLAGDRAGAEATFSRMLERGDTRMLGLRGLHVEARRRGDVEAARHFAEEAEKLGPVPWASEALRDDRAARGDWEGALAVVERSAASRQISKPDSRRRRAVLKTAMALASAEREPDRALALAREANGLSPELVPAAALAARLHERRGEYRKAMKLLERSWRLGPHPDLADAYVNARRGDSAADRLGRARALLALEPASREGRMALAKAAVGARDFDTARLALAPLVESGERPTANVCVAMAELEDAAGGPPGLSREWLARAAHAPRDEAWIADGVISDRWAPASPVTGELDAFVWRRPDERLAAPIEPPPARPPPALAEPAAATAPPAELAAPEPKPPAPILAPDDPGVEPRRK